MLSWWPHFSTEGQMCSRWAAVPSLPCMWPRWLGTSRWELGLFLSSMKCEGNVQHQWSLFILHSHNKPFFPPTRQQIYSCSTELMWMFRMPCFLPPCILLRITATSRWIAHINHFHILKTPQETDRTDSSSEFICFLRWQSCCWSLGQMWMLVVRSVTVRCTWLRPKASSASSNCCWGKGAKLTVRPETPRVPPYI